MYGGTLTALVINADDPSEKGFTSVAAAREYAPKKGDKNASPSLKPEEL